MAFTIDDAWRLHTQGQQDLAINLCNKILQIESGNASALCCRGLAFWTKTQETKQPLVDLRRAAKLAPDNAMIRHNLAVVLASDGKSEAACRQYRRAMQLKPDNASAFYGLAHSMRFKSSEPLVDRMRALADAGYLPEKQQELALFGLAKIYDDIGEYGDAIECVLRASKIETHPFNMADELKRIGQLEKLAESGLLRTANNTGSSEKSPIFIVGMPRSGTTLIESIFARHSSVYAGGEMYTMNNIELDMKRRSRGQGATDGGMDYRLLSEKSSDFDTQAAIILEDVWKKAGKEYQAYTDKMPHNTGRIGLISKIFPRAKVIYSRRHPLDTGVSNFFMRFGKGHGYSYDLGSIGQHSRNVAEMMEYWRKAADVSILDVRYENLVANPEAETRRMLKFAGLKWEKNCLSPEKGKRGVMTASQWQVRQPVYKRSVARWENYREWLDPMIEGMGGMEWIEDYQKDKTE